jgi:hypothetical protein
MSNFKPVGRTVGEMQKDNDAQWKPVAAENADSVHVGAKSVTFKMKQPAVEVGDKAIHLPRRASRRWRGRNFS